MHHTDLESIWDESFILQNACYRRADDAGMTGIDGKQRLKIDVKEMRFR